MGINFAAASSQYLSSPYTFSSVMTMGAWIRVSAAEAGGCALSIALSSAEYDYLSLMINGNASCTLAHNSGSGYHGLVGAGIPDDGKYHWVAVGRLDYLNRWLWVEEAAYYTNNSKGGFSQNNFRVGVYADSSPTNYFDGDIGRVCVWSDGVLTQANNIAISRGVNPLLIRPDLLIGVWDLDGNADFQPPSFGTWGLTKVNGPTKTDGPPLASIKSIRQMQRFASPSAVSGGALTTQTGYWGY